MSIKLNNYFHNLVISLLFIFFSCDISESQYIATNIPKVDTICIHINSAIKQNFSDIFRNIDYILTPYDSIFCIGKFDKMLITDSLIFIMDRRISRGIYTLSHEGIPISAIHKTGAAPGEYVAMRDISYDRGNNSIKCLEIARRKYIEYTLQGDYIKETDIPCSTSRMEEIGNNYIMYTDYARNEELKWKGKYPNLILYNHNNKVIFAENFFQAPAAKATLITSEPQFSKINDTLYSLKPDHCNTIYHITSQQIYPAYILDFGPYNLNDEFWELASKKGTKYEQVNDFSNMKKFCETFRFLEGNDFFYLLCRQQKTLTHIFYSKKTKKIKLISELNNDMDYISLFRPIAIHGNKLYCLLDSETVYNMKNELKGILPDNILNNVEEFGNPIITIFTLKSF